MTENTHAGARLLDAWLNLTSTLWNSRLVSSMTFNEAHVMGLLLRYGADEPPMTATDLIRHTRLLKSQMNKILTSLEERGYLTRIRAQLDRRMIHIRLTTAGKNAYLEAHKGVEELLSRLVDAIGADRALGIARDLSEVVGALEPLIPQP